MALLNWTASLYVANVHIFTSRISSSAALVFSLLCHVPDDTAHILPCASERRDNTSPFTAGRDIQLRAIKMLRRQFTLMRARSVNASCQQTFIPRCISIPRGSAARRIQPGEDGDASKRRTSTRFEGRRGLT